MRYIILNRDRVIKAARSIPMALFGEPRCKAAKYTDIGIDTYSDINSKIHKD